MSLQNREDSCVFCHAYLFEDDDVVYCPVCGAPHHRECYNKLGKCALEELHGTENQYDKAKQKAQQEPKAEPVVEEEPEFQFQSAFSGTGFAPFDFLGGVKPNEEIEEGVTAKDAAKFVFSNTMRYIPKFKALDKKHKNLGILWRFSSQVIGCFRAKCTWVA